MMGNADEMIRQKIRQLFPQESLESILEILDLYGAESYEREKERVHLGILKLSEGNLEKLRSCVQTAKQDPRDILAYSEYPNQMRAGITKLPFKEAKAIRAEDKKQFLDWLQDEG